MNPRQELEDVIREAIDREGLDVPEELAVFIHCDILRWMSRNQIVFYQP